MSTTKASAAAVVLALVVALGVLLVTRDDAAPPGGGDPLVVDTAAGSVRGVVDGSVRTWRGLPYAAAPVGDLRWRPPQPAATWTGIRDAGRFGAGCLQPERYEYGDTDLLVRADSSEDCLFLNVTSPHIPDVAASPESPTSDDAAAPDLPVIVWLHGGGLTRGSGSVVDPTSLAERGAVVVTVNYRLGRLGYFAHPALNQEVANLGLTDQIAALEWVRDNIADFGGDPGSVTLMGASAGAISVNALLVAPTAAGLFDRAIAQSAPGDSAARTLSDVRRQGARDFPDFTAEQLRALPGRELLSSTFNVLLGDAPVIDSVLPESYVEAFAAGHESAVPYLVGTTDAEFSDDDYLAAGGDPDQLRASVGGAGHDALVTAYGAETFREQVLDDLVFQVPATALALEHARRAPTYRYRFAADPGGSGHGSEVAYVFGSETRPAEQRLVEAMGDYWVAFARTGSPEVAGLPRWPRADATRTPYVELGADGPRAVAQDPWTDRLAALYAAAPLRLPVTP